MMPVLFGLEYYTGFKHATTAWDELADAAVAYGVGLVASLTVLAMFNLLSLNEPLSSVIGKVALQAIPASFGAMLSGSQFGAQGAAERRHKRDVGFGGIIFLMAVGALFLSFNVAPTEEMFLIAARMNPWHGIALACASLLIMHGFVYAASFRGAPGAPEGLSRKDLFFRYTVPGYVIALVVSTYVLWTFGRYEGYAATPMIMQALVLGLPASIGAAAARLVV
jgi:putative integral membrane protein (TIGR02587 family)